MGRRGVDIDAAGGAQGGHAPRPGGRGGGRASRAGLVWRWASRGLLGETLTGKIDASECCCGRQSINEGAAMIGYFAQKGRTYCVIAAAAALFGGVAVF